MLKTLRKVVRIGPDDHGRRMTLDQFDHAIGQDGYNYELSKGVIEVTKVPQYAHFAQVQEVRRQFMRYEQSSPGIIHSIASSNEAKLLIGSTESERHPDLSVYLSGPPEVKDVWSLWRPVIVIEVVSASSAKRDYEEKPEDYLELGIDEYWIIDSVKDQMTVLYQWRGRWRKKIVKPSQRHSTHLLPGFSLDLKKVFAAAKIGGK